MYVCETLDSQAVDETIRGHGSARCRSHGMEDRRCLSTRRRQSLRCRVYARHLGPLNTCDLGESKTCLLCIQRGWLLILRYGKGDHRCIITRRHQSLNSEGCVFATYSLLVRTCDNRGRGALISLGLPLTIIRERKPTSASSLDGCDDSVVRSDGDSSPSRELCTFGVMQVIR